MESSLSLVHHQESSIATGADRSRSVGVVYHIEFPIKKNQYLIGNVAVFKKESLLTLNKHIVEF